MTVPVIAFGQTEQDIVGGLERLHGPVTVVRRCTDMAELIAVAQSGLARAVIIAGDSSMLGISLLERLHSSDVAVVVLTDDGGEQHRLAALGVVHAALSIDPEVIAELVTTAVASLVAPRTSRLSASYADPAGALAPATVEEEPVQAPVELGEVTAVWGPAGAPGRTTLAVNLAAELAAAGKRVMLLDADTYGASVAVFLGLMDESAALAQACRLADQGLLDDTALERVSVKLAVQGAPLFVLTGITRTERWTELRPGALGNVIELARRNADHVVIDCGFCLEADEELSFDTMAPRRNGASLRCLELADRVYAVGASDAVGVPRLVRALGELEQVVPTVAPQIVLNKVRSSAVGPAPEDQLGQAWERFGPSIEVKAFLPADFAATDAALLGGSVLLESAPDSPLRLAIAALAGREVAGRRRRRPRRMKAKVTF
ncbi:chromosome partitioning ATPase [Arthrobacter crystallopoietes BAB-32]|uniref:Chromosome partitioning ATPase n=1 Tax=Arthrobacter crystallopoietes BAB-32 TaxID=1246476 RepID=N1V6F1_9MICC|nr:P-loop NTPase [Arthrobacter crystallopoietes]EMY35682.1 chromosome partitioning ATPase [Arthrobacter crystallopoietes BAB-32]